MNRPEKSVERQPSLKNVHFSPAGSAVAMAVTQPPIIVCAIKTCEVLLSYCDLSRSDHDRWDNRTR